MCKLRSLYFPIVSRLYTITFVLLQRWHGLSLSLRTRIVERTGWIEGANLIRQGQTRGQTNKLCQERVGIGLNDQNIQGLQSHEGCIVHVGGTDAKGSQDFNSERSDNFFGRQEGNKQAEQIETHLYLYGPSYQSSSLNVLRRRRCRRGAQQALG